MLIPMMELAQAGSHSIGVENSVHCHEQCETLFIPLVGN